MDFSNIAEHGAAGATTAMASRKASGRFARCSCSADHLPALGHSHARADVHLPNYRCWWAEASFENSDAAPLDSMDTDGDLESGECRLLHVRRGLCPRGPRAQCGPGYIFLYALRSD